MGKIIKSDLEQVQIKKEKFTLSMKGQFKIEFANDSFGPYDYKFGREECYYIDGLDDRGTVKFPLKNKTFNNTEIFLETDDIIICTGERSGLMSDNQTFIDVINLKTEKKQRFFTNEVNLIFNMLDKIFINIEEKGNYKTYILDINTLNILEVKDEYLQAFFKYIINTKTKQNFRLKKSIQDSKKYFELDLITSDQILNISKYDREYFKINGVDIWYRTFIKPEVLDLDFLDNQKYVISEKKKKLMFYSYPPKFPYTGPEISLVSIFIKAIILPIFIMISFIIFPLFGLLIIIILGFYLAYLNLKLIDKNNKALDDYVTKNDILLLFPLNKGYDDKYEVILRNNLPTNF